MHELGWTEPFPESTVDGVEDILGLDISPESYSGEHGAVLMLHGDREGQRLGETQHFGDCFPVLWSVDNQVVLAHEIGHALGLEHTDDPDNLMYEHGAHESPELTDEQVDTMREWAWWLQNC